MDTTPRPPKEMWRDFSPPFLHMCKAGKSCPRNDGRRGRDVISIRLEKQSRGPCATQSTPLHFRLPLSWLPISTHTKSSTHTHTHTYMPQAHAVRPFCLSYTRKHTREKAKGTVRRTWGGAINKGKLEGRMRWWWREREEKAKTAGLNPPTHPSLPSQPSSAPSTSQRPRTHTHARTNIKARLALVYFQ